MYSHIIYFLTLYLVFVFYPENTVQYQSNRQINQFGSQSVQDTKPHFRKSERDPLVSYHPQNSYHAYDTFYTIPHSRELHSVHNRINNRAFHHKGQNLVKSSMSHNHLKSQDKDLSQLVKTREYKRDAKVVDYPDFLSKEGIIPYYQSRLGPSLRMKRSTNTTKANATDEHFSKDDLIKSLEDSFSNPDGLIKDASFVPHIRVKRILEENQ